MKERTVSKRAVLIWFFIVVWLFCTAVVLFFGYHARGKAVDEVTKKLEACEDAKKPQQAAKKPQITKKQVTKRRPVATTKKVSPVAKQAAVPAPVQQAVAVPNYAAVPKLILRINVVEWAPVFEGKSLHSRDIGPVVRQGLANGKVIRTKESLMFMVNGASVSVQGGQAIVDPGTIGPETTLVVQPANGTKFASPPNGLPLTTNPGELDAVVKRGVSEIWMNFILAPAATKSSPKERKNMGGPKGLPSLPLFL